MNVRSAIEAKSDVSRVGERRAGVGGAERRSGGDGELATAQWILAQ